MRLVVNGDSNQAAKVEAWLGKQASPARPASVDHFVLCELAWVLYFRNRHTAVANTCNRVAMKPTFNSSPA